MTRLRALFLFLLAAAGQPQSSAPKADPLTLASVRLMFGLTDSAATVWDGTVAVEKGSVRAIQGVRFGPEDSTDYSSSWKCSTHAQGQEIHENGVFITALTEPDSRWNIHTPRGDFSFTLKELIWGEQLSFLDGAAEATRVPPTSQLTTSDDDEDFPAVTRAGDAIWASFVRFSHSNRAQEAFQPLPKAPENFDSLARPAGGDQVFAMRFAESQRGWSRPEPVSPKGETTDGTAIAADGQGRVWIVWSALRKGNFDLYARASRQGQWGPEIRVTKDAGTDLKPVAVADSKGRVWIAWQGYRNGNLEVLTAVQNGDGFSPEQIVSASKASDWDPAIAASPNGDIAIAWDTYDRGDYDVFFRRLRLGATGAITTGATGAITTGATGAITTGATGAITTGATGAITMDAPVAAAATPLFEARASIAFDAANRLWLAYENSTARWGKEYGTFDTSGTPLYEERSIRVKVFDGASVYNTSSDLLNVMPGAPASAPRSPRPRPNRQPLAPNPNQAKNRRPGTLLNPRNTGSLNTSPHLAADSAGGVYLAFRTLARPLSSRSPVGAVWHEYVTYFDGHKWNGPVFIPRSDGPMEAGMALLPLESAHALSLTAMDHRESTPAGLGAQATERINSDLYAADVRLEGLGPAAPSPELAKIAPEPVPPSDPRVVAERAQVDLVRNYRVEAPGGPYRILRGDFHRHSDYSLDGLREGGVSDAYRYLIDAAALDWGGCCDTDNGEGHEYFWWREQALAEAFKLAADFLPMFVFEHQVRYPEGHRTVMFARRSVRPLPHLAPVAIDAPPAPAPDTRMLYRYLRAFGGISVPHASATDMGTDWRDRDPLVEPAVEIWQGYRQSYESESGPRAVRPGDAIGNLRPAGYVSSALAQGLRLGFTAGSDHVSTHSAYACVLVKEASRESILDAFQKRHIYAATSNIVADVRVSGHLMGDEFASPEAPKLSVKLIGSAAFAKVVVIRDGKEVYTTTPNAKEAAFDWTDPEPPAPGATAYYYVRGEQTDGGLVWTSPMWISRN